MFDPLNWYWLHPDGRIFSSAKSSLIKDKDDAYLGFIARGNFPTAWPKNEEGEQTDEALEAVVSAYGVSLLKPRPTELQAAKAKLAATLKEACAQAITGGYRSSALGAQHLYPSGMTDQMNMTASVTASLIPNLPADWTTAFWCADPQGVWEYRPHSVAEIQKAGADGKDHVMACQWKLATLTASVEAATNLDALSGIAWT